MAENNFLLISSLNFPTFSFYPPVPPRPVTTLPDEESLSGFHVGSLQTLEGRHEVFTRPSVLRAEQLQLLQPVFPGELKPVLRACSTQGNLVLNVRILYGRTVESAQIPSNKRCGLGAACVSKLCLQLHGEIDTFCKTTNRTAFSKRFMPILSWDYSWSTKATVTLQQFHL